MGSKPCATVTAEDGSRKKMSQQNGELLFIYFTQSAFRESAQVQSSNVSQCITQKL